MLIIIDSLIRIKNGYIAKLSAVTLRYSKQVVAILEVLKNEGSILKYVVADDLRSINVGLRYTNGLAALKDIRILSKPGRHIYSSSQDLKKWKKYKWSYLLVSTSQNWKPDYEAREKNIGGTVFAEII